MTPRSLFGYQIISKLGEGRIEAVEDAVNQGDQIEVEVVDVDAELRDAHLFLDLEIHEAGHGGNKRRVNHARRRAVGGNYTRHERHHAVRRARRGDAREHGIEERAQLVDGIISPVDRDPIVGLTGLKDPAQRELAAQQPGYLGIESARGDVNITVSYWADDAADCEYTYYALLALGHLSL